MELEEALVKIQELTDAVAKLTEEKTKVIANRDQIKSEKDNEKAKAVELEKKVDQILSHLASGDDQEDLKKAVESGNLDAIKAQTDARVKAKEEALKKQHDEEIKQAKQAAEEALRKYEDLQSDYKKTTVKSKLRDEILKNAKDIGNQKALEDLLSLAESEFTELEEDSLVARDKDGNKKDIDVGKWLDSQREERSYMFTTPSGSNITSSNTEKTFTNGKMTKDEWNAKYRESSDQSEKEYLSANKSKLIINYEETL